MNTVQVQELPTCYMCEQEGKQTKAIYDTKTSFGPWANLCQAHFDMFGVSPSNKLEIIQKRKARKTFAKIPTVVVPLSLDSLVTVKCPGCGQGRKVETDANYTVTCESCGQEYKLVSML